MKYVKQFFIILLISFVGELFKYLIPLPIPASIYGMVILFIGLMTGLIRLDDVKDVGKFLIESWGTLKPVLLPVCAITVVTIVTVMVATGKLSQWMIRREKKGGSDHE